MTEKKHKAAVRAETNQDPAAAVSGRTKNHPTDPVQTNLKSFQAGTDCQDALMRCYNR